MAVGSAPPSTAPVPAPSSRSVDRDRRQRIAKLRRDRAEDLPAVPELEEEDEIQDGVHEAPHEREDVAAHHVVGEVGIHRERRAPERGRDDDAHELLPRVGLDLE